MNRSVSVTLSARVDPYLKAMDQARAATAKLEKESSMNMARLGGSMTNIGKKMTVGISLPIAGIGAAAVKMSNDFDSTFGQMVGLAGVAAEDVDGLKESVLDLAGTTARAPAELAEALYFAASAGLDTKQSMEAVTIAAKASAAGLGTTQDVVGLVASAVASYGSENIDAARATDILTSAIREGRAEPAELAGALGRVLPVAASLGVEFEEVGGTVAYLSNIFGDTDRTVTAVNDTFAKLAAPTDSARTALEAAGTSADELKRTIADDGLLAGLELLRTHGFQGNAAAIRELMPDMQGATALTALLDDASGSLATTLGAVSDSTGSLNTAFGAIDQDAQAMKQAMVDIQIALIQVGEVIGPIVSDLAGGIGDLAGAFSDLDPALQKVIIGIAGAAAAAGPLLVVTGSLIRNYATLRAASTRLGTSSGALKGKLLGVGIGLTAVTALYVAYNAKKQEAKRRTDEVTEALIAEKEGQEGVTEALWAARASTEEMVALQTALGISAKDLANWMRGDANPAIDEFVAKVRSASDQNSGNWGWINPFDNDDGQKTIDLWDQYGSAAVKAGQELAAFRGETETAEQRANAYGDALSFTTSQLASTSSAARHAGRAARYLTEETDDGTESQEELDAALLAAEESAARIEEQADATAAAMDEWTAFTDALTASHEAMIDEVLGSLSGMFEYEQAVLNLDNAYSAYQAAVEEATDVLASSESTDREKAEALRNLRGEELALADQTYETAAAYAEEQGALEGSSQWAEIMRDKLSEQADAYPELREEIALLIEGLNAIPRNISSSVDITTYYRQVGSSTDRTDWHTGGNRALGGPTFPNTIHEVNENGSELFTENGRTYLMSSSHGFVTPMPAAAPLSSSTTWGADGPIALDDPTIDKLAHRMMTAAGVVSARSEAQLLADYRGGLR